MVKEKMIALYMKFPLESIKLAQIELQERTKELTGIRTLDSTVLVANVRD